MCKAYPIDVSTYMSSNLHIHNNNYFVPVMYMKGHHGDHMLFTWPGSPAVVPRWLILTITVFMGSIK